MSVQNTKLKRFEQNVCLCVYHLFACVCICCMCVWTGGCACMFVCVAVSVHAHMYVRLSNMSDKKTEKKKL